MKAFDLANITRAALANKATAAENLKEFKELKELLLCAAKEGKFSTVIQVPSEQTELYDKVFTLLKFNAFMVTRLTSFEYIIDWSLESKFNTSF